MSQAEDSKKVIVRYPPSPTGKLHVGNLRTMIFNYLFMRNHGGEAILRIEDTNQQRHDDEAEQYIVDSLNWLGLEYSEMHRQSDRTDLYTKYLQQLIDDGKAYISEETHTKEQIKKAEDEGRTLRDSVIRFKNENKVITFHDEVLGEITVDTSDLGDFVIARSLSEPLYHLAVVVDDWQMGITHIFRGDDHVSNTPRQILIQEALGAPRPIYGHLPLVVGQDGKKLSKRHGSVGTLDYRGQGYLPEAFLNFMALIGWNPGTEQEVFTREQLIEAFDVSGIQKKSAVFNQEKLEWFNREHIRLLSDDEQKAAMRPFFENLDGFDEQIFNKVVPEILERVHKWNDIQEMVEDGEVQYFFDSPEYDGEKIVWKKSDVVSTKKHLDHAKDLFSGYDGSWESSDDLKAVIWDYAEEIGRGDVLWPLRYVLSGRDRSPDPFTLLSILGKEESLARIEAGLQKVS